MIGLKAWHIAVGLLCCPVMVAVAAVVVALHDSQERAIRRARRGRHRSQ